MADIFNDMRFTSNGPWKGSKISQKRSLGELSWLKTKEWIKHTKDYYPLSVRYPHMFPSNLAYDPQDFTTRYTKTGSRHDGKLIWEIPKHDVFAMNESCQIIPAQIPIFKKFFSSSIRTNFRNTAMDANHENSEDEEESSHMQELRDLKQAASQGVNIENWDDENIEEEFDQESSSDGSEESVQKKEFIRKTQKWKMNRQASGGMKKALAKNVGKIVGKNTETKSKKKKFVKRKK